MIVCFATKALHLELVSDLTTEACLAALNRFVARRGRVNVIHSDQGTNFVGAFRQLQTLMKNVFESEGILWKFSPPSSPNFGGIWEISVISVKTHLNRVIGGHILTFEELSTLLAQIESVLNSRPLCPMSSDPQDLNPLTPGHFLTMSPFVAFPEPNLSGSKISRLSRWQLLSKCHQDFWARWSTFIP